MDEYIVQKIKDAANVVDVIGSFYELERDGVNKTCLCPFHADRHKGSFKISESKNMYTCYSCGAHGGPIDFLMQHEHMGFLDALEWLAAKYGIDTGTRNHWKDKLQICKPHAPVPPLPMLTLPADFVFASQGEDFEKLRKNTLIKWITSLPWNSTQRARLWTMVRNYQVGHGKDGHIIFWQIDERSQVRTGKLMLYKTDGHRDKESVHNFDYIHSMLYRAGKLDPMDAEATTCYFGQHILDQCPNATVNLVESEKTALLCAIAYGNMSKHIWIATGGLNFLNEKKLEPFIKRKRRIVCYPDRDGIEAWREKVRSINYEHISVNAEIVTKFWLPEDGQKADIADIIVRLLNPSRRDLENLAQQYPIVNDVMNKFELDIVDKK